MGTIAGRAEALLGTAVVATSPVAGGDICVATRLRLSDGTSAIMKTRAHAPADFFRAEADGLAWLAEAGGAPTPDVLAVEDDCIILRYVEHGRVTNEAAEAFGRALATTHNAGSPVFGNERGDTYIGSLPMPNRPADGWPEFFATRRILPYLKLAVDRGGVQPSDAQAIEQVVRRITELAGPDEAPSRLHGDLWSGNVLWGHDGVVHLIDPAAYGGHRETDLAMLALFGLPNLQRVLEAYREASPLADGWEQRVGLHQLFPLLTHATHRVGGGAYGARAGDTARALLRS
ncbi:MAG TPA: fructosamine kinase family protein [Nocardioidaceae bacterium]|nr:fructosamine kinase family protein [Nocardioidaceae bacterium]